MIQIGLSPATIDAPIEHLLACHRRIEQRLDTLIRVGDHLRTNRAAALKAIRNSLDFLDTSGELHTEDEEESLFPRLREKLSAAELTFVESLETDHTKAAIIYAELKSIALTLGAAAEPSAECIEKYLDLANRLRTLYGNHIHAEDEVFMAFAARYLNALDIAEISAEMRTRRIKTRAA